MKRPHWLRRPWQVALACGLAVVALVYAAVGAFIWRHSEELLAHPPQRQADAALVLGSRAYLDGKPHPCLTGRVDTALALARAGLVRQLAFSGGVDLEDSRIEAITMQEHAIASGFTGPMVLEPASTSTRLNLSLSRPLLLAAGVRSVVIVSEPFHLWRVERLVKMSGFDKSFDVQYAAAPTSCWQALGPFSKGALREPAAIINNAGHGYLF
ncbi:YdcF family protein [Variovorax sp. NFACC27]|uniref:YdcF family protein n=1 Tax=unclassified Variovorax TaxID=663243 RepID=UPI00089B64EF|nr:protein SanA, affects membrane permeability for vancomycin [Variovorax sp. NFACC28]SEF60165.1 protein SanA, affects membrane permeability for vancomycin [Variovorax sp. NFACC29]SFB72288.1 protein SanA, affects membrane permeability for vancomycin [Variovorax sp. NFACC26]SFG56943.1 protein SanA, affects membrane permeability for vancomycin [Variovorax sp. NFACC27]